LADSLLVVVGFVAQYGKGAVELLVKNGSYNLVAEGHFAEA